MAMTKKEQAMVEDLRDRLRIAAAFHRTTEVLPDIPVPEYSSTGGLTKGFHPWVSDYVRVEPACSSSCHHAVGRTDRTNSQQAIALYSTRLLALRSGRFQLEEKFAKSLAKVDAEIEREIANPTPLEAQP